MLSSDASWDRRKRPPIAHAYRLTRSGPLGTHSRRHVSAIEDLQARDDAPTLTGLSSAGSSAPRSMTPEASEDMSVLFSDLEPVKRCFILLSIAETLPRRGAVGMTCT